MTSDATVVLMEPMFPTVCECAMCNDDVTLYIFQPNYAVPYYERVIFSDEIDLNSGGRIVCKECYHHWLFLDKIRNSDLYPTRVDCEFNPKQLSLQFT